MATESYDRLAPEPRPPAGSRRRTALLAGASLVTVGAVAAGAFAVVGFLGASPSAEQALPSSTLAEVSIDLDPSAGQKIAAIETLRKFPSFRSQVGIGSRADLRKKVFQQVFQVSGCKGVSYARDIAPWIGDSVGLAAVDAGGDQVAPLLALAVTDTDPARAEMPGLLRCLHLGDRTAYAFVDGFVLVSDTQAHVDRAAKDATAHPLADDAAYRSWTEKAGDPGVANFYVARAAASHVADLRKVAGGGLLGATGSAGQASSALSSFRGAAGALRFADGGMELAVVSSEPPGTTHSREAGKLVAALPADTAAATALSVPDGWVQKALRGADAFSAAQGGGSGPSMLRGAGRQLGLRLPRDLTDLLGQGVSLSLGGTPPRRLAALRDPSTLPLGLTVSGRPGKVKRVVRTIAAHVGSPVSDIAVESGDGKVTLSLDRGYARALQKGGYLAGDATFAMVVPDVARDDFVGYLNFNSQWRSTVARTLGRSGKEFLAETEPLQGLGVSTWGDGTDQHLLVKVRTD